MNPHSAWLPGLVSLVLLSASAFGQSHSSHGTAARDAIRPRIKESYSWRYYRVGNTGIQGDYNEAVWVGPDGDPYIGGYDPAFEEGGFSKFIQGENRWVNYSNVDYPVIGHPNDTGCTRVIDIVPDATGKLWIGTWRGALTFDPMVGASSLRHYGPANSALVDDRVWDIDRAPDGTMWFANNGMVRYDPANDTWTQWPLGNVFMSVQPKTTGGYLVWSSSRAPERDYTFVFDSDTQ
ncbi:MAG TPA: two-component regulator propeller domain-containing protein, partial [Pirellulaceae bacterium]